MKELFRLVSYLSLMFITLTMCVITFTTMFVDTPRHPWTSEGLLDMIFYQTVLLAVYFACKIGIYMCNTYSFNVEKKRAY